MGTQRGVTAAAAENSAVGLDIKSQLFGLGQGEGIKHVRSPEAEIRGIESAFPIRNINRLAVQVGIIRRVPGNLRAVDIGRNILDRLGRRRSQDGSLDDEMISRRGSATIDVRDRK